MPNANSRYTSSSSSEFGSDLVTVEEPVINEIVSREDVARSEIESLIRRKYTKIGHKPDGFDSIEIRGVGQNRYRVNIVCKTYKRGDFFPSFTRPISYYVVDKNDSYEFSPEL